MPGSGAQKRKHALARQVYHLSQRGHTHREIAAAVDVEPRMIKKLVELGERMESIEPTHSQS